MKMIHFSSNGLLGYSHSYATDFTEVNILVLLHQPFRAKEASLLRGEMFSRINSSLDFIWLLYGFLLKPKLIEGESLCP